MCVQANYRRAIFVQNARRAIPPRCKYWCSVPFARLSCWGADRTYREARRELGRKGQDGFAGATVGELRVHALCWLLQPPSCALARWSPAGKRAAHPCVQLEELQGFWFLYKLENNITFNTTEEDLRAFADFILRVGDLTRGAEDEPPPPPSERKRQAVPEAWMCCPCMPTTLLRA